jgi:hypothetical protein
MAGCASLKVYFGAGAPAIVAPVGSLYFDTAVLYAQYVFTAGGWLPVT